MKRLSPVRTYYFSSISKDYALESLLNLFRDALQFLESHRTCFVGETVVKLENDYEIPIEQVKVGDKVKSFDPKTGCVITNTVQVVYESIRSDLIEITFESVKSGGKFGNFL
jgi:hypothetical protein